MNNSSKKLNNVFVVSLIALICCLLWGSAFPMIKIGYKLFDIKSNDTGTIILFAGIRFFFAGIFTIIIFSILNKRLLLPNKCSIKKIGILSIFQTILQYLFFYLGLAFSTGVKSSIINGSSVFIALLISSLLFKQETLNSKKIFGTLIGFFGVFVAGFFGTNAKGSFQIGDLYILLSAVSYSFSSVFMKKFSKDDNPAMLSGYQFILGGFVMIIVGYIIGGRISFSTYKGVLVLAYLSMLSAIAYSLWSILLKYNDVSRIAVFGSFTPIFGFMLSYLFLGEENGSLLFNLLGLIFVVIGMLVVNIKIKTKRINS